MHGYYELPCSLYSITGADDKIMFSKVQIHSDGEVEWWRIGQFSSTCEIDVALYPFDKQECSMVFIAWYENDVVSLVDLHFVDREDDNRTDFPDLIKEEAELRVEGEWKIVGKFCMFFFVIRIYVQIRC